MLKSKIFHETGSRFIFSYSEMSQTSYLDERKDLCKNKGVSKRSMVSTLAFGARVEVTGSIPVIGENKNLMSEHPSLMPFAVMTLKTVPSFRSRP